MSYFRYTPLILVVVLAAVAVRLGIWQLDRLDERRAANAVFLAQRELPPVSLEAPDPADSALPGRRISARGRFATAGELLLRNRARNQAPGVHVVTPFRTDQGDLLLVLRGFAFAPDGVTPPAVTPADSGEVEIAGIAWALPETDDGGAPLEAGGRLTLQRLDPRAAAEAHPGSLPVVLYLAGDTAGPGRLHEVPPPSLDEGPHLSYALQWFGIATAILAFGWIVIVRRRADRGLPPPPAAP